MSPRDDTSSKSLLWNAYGDGWVCGVRMLAMAERPFNIGERKEWERGYRDGKHAREEAWAYAAKRLDFQWGP